MSNLVKPYEISVWDDIWDSDEEKFVEKKLLVIGTDEMTSLNRALEPVLTRNVNGTKKFSFKMYKRYIDRETGEEVHNLFIDYLINERKIKLKYGVDDEGNAKWYDFIIKNVNETSTTYLYQFDLEDAIVQELSKNGFGVTLDAQLNNNMGTADQLAEKVLADTDWTVAGSDKLVQEVKEHLVYVSYIQDPQPETLKIYMLKNSGDSYDLEGVEEVQKNNLTLKDKKILVFYSSCTGKPHRFQFIILPEYIEKNEDNVIINKDCQYFIEYNPEDYTVENKEYGFNLPAGWCVQDQGNVETDDKDTTVSYKYRGNRFGYAQQAVYLPKLDRYVNKYTHDTYGDIYGYVDNEYISPVLMTNLISNTEFKNTSGWKGVGYTEDNSLPTKPKTENKPIVENVYGRFDIDGNFISAMTDLTNGSFTDQISYEAYIKLDFSKVEKLDNVTPTVINSGPFDNRTIIGEIIEGDEWALYVKDREGNWPTGLTFTLEEVKYDSGTGCYKQTNSGKISFASSTTTSPQIFTFGDCDYSDKTFKKNVKLHLKITDNGSKGTYYIKTIELHKVVRDKYNKIVRLNAQEDKIDEGVVNTKYFYFTEGAYDAVSTKDEIKYIHTADKAEPSTYKPVYNAGAEKIRSVTAKESNYFNILQSIAETFEAWLDLKITRDDNGAVTNKQVSFKKYSGGDNYAAFRYGVNLKDITRTTESKQIVTKLIVKNNSNELAPNKFCTIQRAPSNVSGENYIYDFQYYQNNGLLDADDYLNELYYTAGASGLDIEYQKYKDDSSYIINEKAETNIKGYFPRLKALNNQLVEINEQMSGLSQELLQLKAEREVAEATYEAAESGIEQTSEDFETLTGFGITAYSVKQVTSSDALTRISIWSPEGNEEVNESSGSYLVSEDLIDITKYPSVSLALNPNAFAYTLNLSRVESEQSLKTINATLYTPIKVGATVKSGVWMYQATPVKFKFESKTSNPSGYTTAKVEGTFNAVDTERSDVNKLLTEYLTYQQEKTDSGDEKDRLTELIDGTIILDNEGHPVLDEKDEPKRNNDGKQYTYNALKQQFEDIRDNQKLSLNKAFFQKYSRFIQEGTWIDEQYVDDEKYYNDAQTVLYNSCYPKVGYTINVLSLSKMPGYELFVFDVGEKTYAEDEEFFGTDANGYPNRTEIIITEMSEHLDNPSADSIKVQNFKNQFQDLFQKITATVQQTQYNEGTYRKGAALIEASNAKKNEFLLDSLSDPASVLSNAGQNEVVWDSAGITVTNTNNRSEQLRLVSSGIMFSTDSEGGPKWSTGITPQGISANKILAGSINTGEISLMNGKDASFLWNAFGINAFDYTIENGTIVGVNKNKFVRFDRNGIYGINGLANADTWTPEDLNEVEDKATFALTWEGLKVTGNNGVVAKIGKSIDDIINVQNSSGKIFGVTNDGDVFVKGEIEAISGKIGDWLLSEGSLRDMDETIYFQPSSTLSIPSLTSDATTTPVLSIGTQATPIIENVEVGSSGTKSLPTNEGEGGTCYSWSFDIDKITSQNKEYYLSDYTSGYIKVRIKIQGSIEYHPGYVETVTITDDPVFPETIEVFRGADSDLLNYDITIGIDESIFSKLYFIPDSVGIENYLYFESFYPSVSYHEERVWSGVSVDFSYITASYLGGGLDLQTPEYELIIPFTSNSKKVNITCNFGHSPSIIFNDQSFSYEIFYFKQNIAHNQNLKEMVVAKDGSVYLPALKSQKILGYLGSGALIEENALLLYDKDKANDSCLGLFFAKNDNWNDIRLGLFPNTYLSSGMPIDNLGDFYSKDDFYFYLKNNGELQCGDIFPYYPIGTDGHYKEYTHSNYTTFCSGTLGIGTPYLGVQNGVIEKYWWDSYICHMYTKYLIPTQPYLNEEDKVTTNGIVYESRLGDSVNYWGSLYVNDAYVKNNQSDIRVKNSIEPFDERYERLFESLQPVRYKYNEGTSNRYHTGFIAQQVVESIEKAELTTKDFAAVVLNEPNTENECWFLRRDEFIALNTDQIQKLKPRVFALEQSILSYEPRLSTLEQTILDYESRISNLETEIQNLKSSQNSDII